MGAALIILVILGATRVILLFCALHVLFYSIQNYFGRLLSRRAFFVSFTPPFFSSIALAIVAKSSARHIFNCASCPFGVIPLLDIAPRRTLSRRAFFSSIALAIVAKSSARHIFNFCASAFLAEPGTIDGSRA